MVIMGLESATTIMPYLKEKEKTVLLINEMDLDSKEATEKRKAVTIILAFLVMRSHSNPTIWGYTCKRCF